MNKRIVAGSMSILTAMALMAGSTFALFSDTAISQNNTFSTATADLQIANNVDNGDDPDTPDTFGNEIAAPAINEQDILPGFSKTYMFWLKNNSSGTLNMDLSGSFDDVVTTGNSDIANQLSVTIDCGTSGGPFTVNAWDAGSAPLGTLAAGAQVQCSMDVSLANVDNTYQNSSVRFDGVFTGTQN